MSKQIHVLIVETDGISDPAIRASMLAHDLMSAGHAEDVQVARSLVVLSEAEADADSPDPTNTEAGWKLDTDATAELNNFLRDVSKTMTPVP